MLRLSQSQLIKMGEPALLRFVKETIGFMRAECPDHTAGKSDEELARTVNEYVALGKRYSITSELNVQKLLYHSIRYKLSIPFSEPLEHALRAKGWDQNYRIKRFIKLIVTHAIR